MLVSLSTTGLLSLAGILIALIFAAACARQWLWPREPSSPHSPRSPSRALLQPASPRSPISREASEETLFGDPEYGGATLGRLPRGGSVAVLPGASSTREDNKEKLQPLRRSFSASPSCRREDSPL